MLQTLESAPPRNGFVPGIAPGFYRPVTAVESREGTRRLIDTPSTSSPRRGTWFRRGLALEISPVGFDCGDSLTESADTESRGLAERVDDDRSDGARDFLGNVCRRGLDHDSHQRFGPGGSHQDASVVAEGPLGISH